jgi:CRP/FNR family nitrogen fixation transcriptional regulator
MRQFAEGAATAFRSATPVQPGDDVMSQMALRMTYSRDEEIFAQEEEADLIYRVVSGAVRTTRLTADGRRQIGDFYYPGEFFGIEMGDEHRFSAEALCECTVLMLKRTAFRQLAERDGRLERLYWEATGKALHRTQEHLFLLARKTACEKVASFLTDMAERQESDQVSLPMGRQDMADFLGLTIETVSRMLTQLQASGVVEFLDARHFRIGDPRALARLSQ